MRAKLCLSLIAFGLLCAVAMAQEQPSAVISRSSAGSAAYITHVTVIDTGFGKEVPDRTVIISGDRISEVRDSKGTCMRFLRSGWIACFPCSWPTASSVFETWERPCL